MQGQGFVLELPQNSPAVPSTGFGQSELCTQNPGKFMSPVPVPKGRAGRVTDTAVGHPLLGIPQGLPVIGSQQQSLQLVVLLFSKEVAASVVPGESVLPRLTW